MRNLFKTSVISSWKYAGACTSPKGILMYSYFPNGEVKDVWVLRAHPREYGGILLTDPMWRSNFLHLIGRKYPLLWHGPN